MNKIFTFTFLGALGLALVAQAAPRSEADALRLAKSFYASQQPLRSASEASFQLVYTGESGSLRSTSSDPYYYIYNVGEGGGFVMISGDDRVDPVIGYSTSGGFDPANMPSNLKAWFAGYERQIDYARTRPEEVFSASGALRSTEGWNP